MPFFFRAQNDFSRGSEKQSFCFDVLLNHFAASYSHCNHPSIADI